MTLKVVILGALSAIAEATARLYAAEGAALLLVGRNLTGLQAVASDLEVRGASAVHVVAMDLADIDARSAQGRLDDWTARLGGVDHVILAYGVLGDQSALEQDLDAVAPLMNVNFTSAAIWCLAAADRLEAQAGGSLVVLGSVAGDRGRKSNYVYGASKAGLAVLVQGIAHRLSRSTARAVLVKPGFVDTPMTVGIARRPKILWSTPEQVARTIRGAALRGGPVVYAPGFWRLIMLTVRLVPAPIFHRTEL